MPHHIAITIKHSYAALIFLIAGLTSCGSLRKGDSIGSAHKCEIHGCKMEHVVLTLDEYADRTRPEAFYAARASLFPNTGTAFPVCTFYPNRDMTWRCPECARSGAIWCGKHLRNRPLL